MPHDTHHGQIVPWTTLWTAELQAIEDAPYEHVRPFLMNGRQFNLVRETPGLAGNGEPLFDKVATSRAIECARAQRCRVCKSPPIEKGQSLFWCVQTLDKPEVFTPGKTLYGPELPYCPTCAGLAAGKQPQLVPDDKPRIWLMGTQQRIAGAILSPNPSERDTVHCQLEDVTTDFVVRQWCVLVKIDAVIGSHEELVKMQAGAV